MIGADFMNSDRFVVEQLKFGVHRSLKEDDILRRRNCIDAVGDTSNGNLEWMPCSIFSTTRLP